MLKDNIRSWLEGSQNFIVGRALYKQLGDDDDVRQQLQKGEHAGTKKLLHEALVDLLEKSAKTTKEVDPVTDEMPAAGDPVLNALAEEWKPLYARMNYLRASVDQYGESNALDVVAKREKIAFEIIDLDDQCEAIWEKRDHYIEHGVLPNVDIEALVIPVDPRALARLIQNTERNIRRNRLKMEVPNADALYVQLYTMYKERYKLLTGKDYVEKR